MNEKKTVLVVDDSENDLLLMQRAFKKVDFDNPLQMVQGGEKAIAYLKGEGDYADRTKFPLPVLLILDLNMPVKNGFDVLKWVRAEPTLKRLPVYVLSASMRIEDVERSFDLGANSFLVKPIDIEDLLSLVRCLRDWLKINHFPPIYELIKA